jgi:hypothetical protein
VGVRRHPTGWRVRLHHAGNGPIPRGVLRPVRGSAGDRAGPTRGHRAARAPGPRDVHVHGCAAEGRRVHRPGGRHLGALGVWPAACLHRRTGRGGGHRNGRDRSGADGGDIGSGRGPARRAGSPGRSDVGASSDRGGQRGYRTGAGGNQPAPGASQERDRSAGCREEGGPAEVVCDPQALWPGPVATAPQPGEGQALRGSAARDALRLGAVPAGGHGPIGLCPVSDHERTAARDRI